MNGNEILLTIIALAGVFFLSTIIARRLDGTDRLRAFQQMEQYREMRERMMREADREMREGKSDD